VRQVIRGDGTDSTTAAQAYLDSTGSPRLYDLILIGPPENPNSLWLTNYEAPLIYTPYGKFNPAVLSRGMVEAKIGLDPQDLAITWSPGLSASAAATVNTGTASPYQLARLHFYDNWPVLILRCIMPTPGDANTIGCAVWYGGRVQTTVPQRNRIVFNTRSYLDVISQKVPSTVIEVTNTLAATTALTLPTGDPTVPIFKCVAGSSENYIIADCLSPTVNRIYSGNLFRGGYMVFLAGAGATLAGAWSAISQNGEYTDGGGGHHSEFEIYSPLPWPPTPTVDTFYVSKAPPVNLGDEGYFGFPFVPNPTSAV